MESCSENVSVVEPTRVHFNMQVSGVAHTQEALDKLKVKFHEGFEVPLVDDLRGQMIKVLREDSATFEQQVRDLEVQLMNERRAHMATKEELKNARATFNFFKDKAGK